MKFRIEIMNRILIIIFAFCTSLSFSQEEDKERVLALNKANNYVYEGNKVVGDDFISGEMEYRRALSENSVSVEGNYNLGNAYYDKGNFEEALYRHQQAATNSKSKAEKHKAFHNIGNILMQKKQCKEAVEAYKNALRNNPTDNETRYNLGLAKECAKNEQENKDQNEDDKNNEDNKDDNKDQQDKDDKNKENKDKDGDNKDQKENEDEGDQKEKDGDDKEDENKKPDDEKDDKGKQGDKKDDKEKKQPKPQPGKMSPQQIKNLLEAMNNQEQKVQEKMNAEKQKGVKIKTDKDW